MTHKRERRNYADPSILIRCTMGVASLIRTPHIKHSPVAYVRLHRCSLMVINWVTQSEISFYHISSMPFLTLHFYFFPFCSWSTDLGIFHMGRSIQTRILLWWRIADASIPWFNHQKLDAVHHWNHFTRRFGEYKTDWSGSRDYRFHVKNQNSRIDKSHARWIVHASNVLCTFSVNDCVKPKQLSNSRWSRRSDFKFYGGSSIRGQRNFEIPFSFKLLQN